MNIQETAKMLQKASGKIEVDVNGFIVNLKADVNGGGMIVATYALLSRIVKETGKPIEEIILLLLELYGHTHAIECESKEQQRVMAEILKRVLDKEET